MASGGDVHSILYKGNPLLEEFKPRFDPSKRVRRYFPGRAPDFAAGERESDDDSGGGSEGEAPTPAAASPVACVPVPAASSASPLPSPPPSPSLSPASPDGEQFDLDALQPLDEPRPVAAPRERAVAHAEAAVPVAAAADEAALLFSEPGARGGGFGEPGGAESEDDSDGSEAEFERPRFVAAGKRRGRGAAAGDGGDDSAGGGSGASGGLSAAAAGAACGDAGAPAPLFHSSASSALSPSARRIEARQLLVRALQREEFIQEKRRARAAAADPVLQVTDDDGADEEGEFERWKVRELARIERDAAERRAGAAAAATAAAAAAAAPAAGPSAPKTKYAFLQKYYHKGAFYQDLAAEEAIYQRDYNQPVEEDRVDKQLLPTPLQVRRGQFGLAGQVKHKHLAAEDTTDFSAPWAQKKRGGRREEIGGRAAAGTEGAEAPSRLREPAKRPREPTKWPREPADARGGEG